MIIKVIKNRTTDPRNAFRPLFEYVRQEHKVDWEYASSAFVLRPDDAWWEMQCVADQNTRVRFPAYHLVVSLSPGDRATQGQLQEVVDEIAETLGCRGHQFWAAAHCDAMHQHVHIILNRVGVAAGAAAPLAYNRTRLRALALQIEARYGWVSVPPPRLLDRVPVRIGDEFWRYGDLCSAPVNRTLAAARPFVSRLSFQDWLAGEPRRAAFHSISSVDASWEQLHADLAKFGVRYEADPRGAIVVDAVNPKLRGTAGHLGRFLTLPKAQARLGPYEPPSRSLIYSDDNSYHRKAAAHDVPDPLAREYEAYRRGFVGDLRRLKTDQRESELKRLRAVKQETRRLCAELKRDPNPKIKCCAASVLPVFIEIGRAKAWDLKRLFSQERAHLAKALASRAPLGIMGWLHSVAKSGHAEALAFLQAERERRAIRLRPPAPLVVLTDPPSRLLNSAQEVREAARGLFPDPPSLEEAARTFLRGLLRERKLDEQVAIMENGPGVIVRPVRIVKAAQQHFALFETGDPQPTVGFIQRVSPGDSRQIADAILHGGVVSWDPDQRAFRAGTLAAESINQAALPEVSHPSRDVPNIKALPRGYGAL